MLQLGEVVYYPIGTSLFQLSRRSVAIGYATSKGVGAAPHLDIERHVAHNERFLGLYVKVFERKEHWFGMRFGVGNVVGTHNKADVGANADAPHEVGQRIAPTTAGNGER